jgi:glyoxylase-like metal-dependent hydrolase (beta-lactamase superfamily II)
MIPHLMQGWRVQNGLLVIFAILLGASAATQRPALSERQRGEGAQIQTGGPIPDRRGFNDKIMANIRRISDKPIRIVVNTHSHIDHNQNNAVMFGQGAVIFNHPNTRVALLRQGQPA